MRSLGERLAGESAGNPSVERLVLLPSDRERALGFKWQLGLVVYRPVLVPTVGELKVLAEDSGTGSVVGDARMKSGARLAVVPALFAATFLALLYRYTHQTRVSVDVFLGGGGAREGDGAVGIDCDISGDESTDILLGKSLDAFTTGAPPEARANVGLAFGLSGAEVDHLGYDVVLTVQHGTSGFEMGARYNHALFEAASVDRLLSSYATLIHVAFANPALRIDKLPLLQVAEVERLEAQLASGSAGAAEPMVLLQFRAQVAAAPEATAVSSQGAALTYRELDERSSALAHYLVARGVGPEVAVAVCLVPQVEILVAMLAIWKARGLYVPLDPTHPPLHIERMVSEAKPRLVLTIQRLAELTPGSEHFFFDAHQPRLDGLSTEAPLLEPEPTDGAYVFFTSGTTGTPKGVVSEQRNLTQYVSSARQKYGFTAADVFCSLARYTFSISLFELVSPLCVGAEVRLLSRDQVLAPAELVRALEEVTVLHAGPSLLRSLFGFLRATPSHPGTLPRMRHASSGGDIVAPSVMNEMQRVFPKAELFVIYGCTEVACMATTFPIPRDKAVGRTFVGKPFRDVLARVEDGQGIPVPFGVVGEIVLGGRGIARGYLGRAELTAEKFAVTSGARYYRTGDMGRVHPDGNIEIVGRRDFQVQLRGIRLELGGIEKSVQALGLAAECTVVVKTLGDGDVRLVAFVVRPTAPSATLFRKALGAELPDYMVPHHVVPIAAMPLTANGKVDRKGLQELPWDVQYGSAEGALPETELERQVAAVFARVLRRAEVSLDASFFDLGGDSLLGVVLLSELERTVGLTLAAHVLFEAPTVRAVARAQGNASVPRPILLNSPCDGPKLFLLSGVQIYRSLARALDGVCNAYGVFSPREIETLEPQGEGHSVQELAAAHVAMIQAVEPHGPYCLLGYSFAGIVAYEVAQQLEQLGETVRFLALVDAQLPEWILGWKYRRIQLRRFVEAPPRDVWNWLRRRFTGRDQPPSHEFLRYGDDHRLGPLERARDDVNRVAAERYLRQIRQSRGPLTLIVSEERLHEDPLKSPTCGWGSVVERLNVHGIDTDHFQMLREPYVSEMARVLAMRLNDQRYTPSAG
jgi:amino acid adenylation domain-containing protein